MHLVLLYPAKGQLQRDDERENETFETKEKLLCMTGFILRILLEKSTLGKRRH